MTAVRVGRKAPDFGWSGAGGKPVKLSHFRGKKNIILYFYPRDHTPGCTKEASAFRECYGAFKESDTEVIGVSPDSAASHDLFSRKLKLPFVLVSDEDRRIAKRYGVWKEKSLYGRKLMGIERTTFLIDKEGKVRRIFPKVKVEGHEAQILEALSGMEI